MVVNRHLLSITQYPQPHTHTHTNRFISFSVIFSAFCVIIIIIVMTIVYRAPHVKRKRHPITSKRNIRAMNLLPMLECNVSLSLPLNKLHEVHERMNGYERIALHHIVQKQLSLSLRPQQFSLNRMLLAFFFLSFVRRAHIHSFSTSSPSSPSSVLFFSSL